MSLTMKRILMILLGSLASAMIWPFLLIIQHFQVFFPGYVALSLAQGLVFGAIYGAVFGSFEGIAVSSRPKAINGALFGALAGLLSGAIGVFSAQALLFFLASLVVDNYSMLSGTALMLSRGTGWVIIGICLTIIEGVRSRSFRRVFVGLLGGISGGLLGGITLQAMLTTFPGNSIALLVGLVLFGFSLAFFYTVFEHQFSAGTLKLLNGRLKGKEYHLVRNRMTIGSADYCDIVLKDYRGVMPLHAVLVIKKGKVALSPGPEKAPILVNDGPLKDAALRREDVFALGSARFMYGIFI